MPRCAVIVAAFDAESWLHAAIDSLTAQEPLDGWQYDIVVGVDGCEATASALDALGMAYWWSPKNVGAYVMRNSLIAANPADVYAIFDSDDIARPSMLRKLIGPAMSGGISASWKQCFSKGPGDGPVYRYGGGICAMSGEAWKAVGGYHPDRVACDTDIVCRMNLAGMTLTVVEEPLYDYRRHEKSLTGAKATDMASKTRTDIMVRHDMARMRGTVHIDPVTAPLERRHAASSVSFAGQSISVVIPAPTNSECPYRAELLRHCRAFWERLGVPEIIEVAPTGKGDYCKAGALNVGAAAASGNVLVFADADVVIDPALVAGAVRAVASGAAKWACPNRTVLRLTEHETSLALSGIPIRRTDTEPYGGQDAGGLFVVSRAMYATVGGADTRFVGWGGEDTALSIALRTIAAPWRPAGGATLVHLWHPPAASRGDRMSTDAAHNPKNHALYLEYRQHEGNRADMEALRARGYEHGGKAVKYQITRGTVVDGQRVRAGQVVDVPDALVVRFSIDGLIRPPEIEAEKAACNEGARRDSDAVRSVPKPRTRRGRKPKAKVE